MKKKKTRKAIAKLFKLNANAINNTLWDIALILYLIFLPFPSRGFLKVLSKLKLSESFIFTLLRGAFKAFIKPFEAPQKSMKIKISLNFFSSSRIGAGREFGKNF